MSQERFWELISLKLSGEAASAELVELETYLLEHPEEGFRMEAIIQLWNSKSTDKPVGKEGFNKHMQRLSSHLSDPVLQYENPVLNEEEYNEKPTGRSIVIKIILMTGIAASIIAAFFLLMPRNSQPSANKSQAQNTVSTKRGSKSKISLPDGTQGWLNADSRIV